MDIFMQQAPGAGHAAAGMQQQQQQLAAPPPVPPAAPAPPPEPQLPGAVPWDIELAEDVDDEDG